MGIRDVLITFDFDYLPIPSSNPILWQCCKNMFLLSKQWIDLYNIVKLYLQLQVTGSHLLWGTNRLKRSCPHGWHFQAKMLWSWRKGCAAKIPIQVTHVSDISLVVFYSRVTAAHLLHLHNQLPPSASSVASACWKVLGKKRTYQVQHWCWDHCWTSLCKMNSYGVGNILNVKDALCDLALLLLTFKVQNKAA